MSVPNLAHPFIPLTNKHVLYKYMERRWAEEAIHLGRLRIGTLNQFRAAEGVRGDTGEGEEIRVFHPTFATGTDLPDWLPLTVEPGADPKSVTIQNLRLSRTQQVPDVYAFCCSTILTQELNKRFGTDTVLRIEQPIAFLELMTYGMLVNKHIDSPRYFQCPVFYRSRTFIHGDPLMGMPTAFLKPCDYWTEQEFRCLWRPRYRKILPVFLANTCLCKHLSIVDPKHIPETSAPIMAPLSESPASPASSTP